MNNKIYVYVYIERKKVEERLSGVEGNRQLLFNGYIVVVGMINMFGCRWWWWLYNVVDVFNATELYTYRWLTMINMLYILPSYKYLFETS